MSMLGKRVETAVFVAGKRIPMWEGTVVEERADNCKVDIGCGRQHWEAIAHLRVVPSSDQLSTEP